MELKSYQKEVIADLARYLELVVELQSPLLEQSGAWISRDGTNIAQGRPKAKLYLEQNQDLCDELEKELRQKWKDERESNATMAAANHVEDWNVSGSVKEEISETVE